MNKSIEGKEILPYLYKKEWFKESQNFRKEVLAHWYSIIGLDFTKNEIRLDLLNKIVRPYSVKILIIMPEELPFIVHQNYQLCNEYGEDILLSQAFQASIPRGHYLLISIRNTDLDSARKVLDEVASILRISIGNNFLRKLYFSSLIDIETGEMKSIPPIEYLSNPIQNPVLDSASFSTIEEIVNSLHHSEIPEDKKRRIQTALNIFEKASQEHPQNKVIFYRTSLDILCSTDRLETIKQRLAKAYNLTSSEVEKKFLIYEQFQKIRNEIVHKGILHLTLPPFETYLHCLFLDILRYELNLSCERHLEKLFNKVEDPQELFFTKGIIGKFRVET